MKFRFSPEEKVTLVLIKYNILQILLISSFFNWLHVPYTHKTYEFEKDKKRNSKYSYDRYLGQTLFIDKYKKKKNPTLFEPLKHSLYMGEQYWKITHCSYAAAIDHLLV